MGSSFFYSFSVLRRLILYLIAIRFTGVDRDLDAPVLRPTRLRIVRLKRL
jgi:hypothetical protein